MAMHKKNSHPTAPFLWIILSICVVILIAILCFFLSKKKQQDGTAMSRENAKTTHTTDTTKSDSTQASKTDSDKDTEPNTTKPKTYTLQCETPVLLMKRGDSFSPKIQILPADSTSGLRWKSKDPSIATVSDTGKITAKKDGTTSVVCSLGGASTILYVNVLTDTPDGKQGKLTLYNKDGKELTYTLYHQSAHNYYNYNSYLAWHGCATCSITTVLNGFSKTYQTHTPANVIDSIEKTVVGNDLWTEHHVRRSNDKQMPPSMYGISSILSYAGIKTKYVRTYEKSEAREEILNHLRTTGNPVIFEVKKQSNITGEKNTRWTGSVHTMVFLGVYTSGEVLVCDSVNRSWYSGGQRAKIVPIDDPMEYMYSCTSTNNSLYYKSTGSDGGYILVE